MFILTDQNGIEHLPGHGHRWKDKYIHPRLKKPDDIEQVKFEEVMVNPLVPGDSSGQVRTGFIKLTGELFGPVDLVVPHLDYDYADDIVLLAGTSGQSWSRPKISY